MMLGLGLGLPFRSGTPGAGVPALILHDNFTGIAANIAGRVPDTVQPGSSTWVDVSSGAGNTYKVDGSGNAIKGLESGIDYAAAYINLLSTPVASPKTHVFTYADLVLFANRQLRYYIRTTGAQVGSETGLFLIFNYVAATNVGAELRRVTAGVSALIDSITMNLSYATGAYDVSVIDDGSEVVVTLPDAQELTATGETAGNNSTLAGIASITALHKIQEMKVYA